MSEVTWGVWRRETTGTRGVVHTPGYFGPTRPQSLPDPSRGTDVGPRHRSRRLTSPSSVLDQSRVYLVSVGTVRVGVGRPHVPGTSSGPRGKGRVRSDLPSGVLLEVELDGSGRSLWSTVESSFLNYITRKNH